MKRPLVVSALVFCLGIVVAGVIRIPFLIAYALTAIFLLFSFLSVKHELSFKISLCFLIFLLGVISLKNSYILPKCHIRNYNYFKNSHSCFVRGFINSQPELKNGRPSFIFQAKEIQSGNLKRNCCGNILVYAKSIKGLHYGEELSLTGNLHRPYRFGTKGRRSYADYLANQDIYLIMHVETVTYLKKNKGSAIKRFALWLKDKMEGIIFKYVSPLPGSILDAMILGERKGIPALIYNSMVKSGTVHILVVSGFNVGLVFFIIILFLKLLRLPRKARICAAIPLLIVYCLVTGASNPVVRATIMAIVFLAAYLFKREPDIYNSLALAALFILWLKPRQLYDIGFQLSFVSVLSIVCLYPKINSLLNLKSLRIKYIRFLAEGCAVSLSAWAGTAGFIAYYFKIFSPVTVLANLFIVPLATLITLAGFSLIIVGLLCPPLAQLFSPANEFLAALLLNINAFLIKLPGASFSLS